MGSFEYSRQTNKAWSTSTTPTGGRLDILSRLPIKSLLRFMVVSKRWYSLISEPSFIQLHLNLATKNPQNDDSYIIHNIKYNDNFIHLFHINSPQNCPDLELPYCKGDFPLLPNFFLVGCCNGIVCVTINGLYEDQLTYLWNPATRHSKLLPSSIIQGVGNTLSRVWFHPIETDYKFVRVVEVRKISKGAEVYSANKNSWREIEGVPLNLPCYSIFDVGLKGVLYWATLSCLFTFDLNTEVFVVNHFPDNVYDSISFLSNICVTSFKDSTSMIIHSTGDDSNHIISLWTIGDVYLRSDGIEERSCTEKFSVEVPPTSYWVDGYMKTDEILVRADGEIWFLYISKNEETKNKKLLNLQQKLLFPQ